MFTKKKCPICGASLEVEASGRHCLRCLLTLALTNDDPLPDHSGGVAQIEKPGDTIGRYKLLYQIGEGGCGVVYLAEQGPPVSRHVALKVIKLGMDTKDVVARFEAERQAMALMDHPNIAKALDAGATSTGRPFFVMELVRGIKITEYCDRKNLSTRERLDLFIQVCQAIQHAHQKGVIHRDIKPSNILVTANDGVAVPKVIDFGIAKATQQPLTDKTVFTAFEQFIGTPAYMSPEQAEMNSAGIDTRSDIYSLGVLLYELLTGQTPFDTRTLLKAGFEEIRRTIRDLDPDRPSTRLRAMMEGELTTAAHHRRTEGHRLISTVRGDLDWIVMRALEKDRTRRYETANGLAMDIRRHLDDEPVLARPQGNLYRFRKMIRRNKLAFISSAVVLVTLVAGLAISTWQFLEKSRAEQEQARLRREAQMAEADEAQLRRQAEAQELVARRKAYAVSMNLCQRALQEDDLGRAIELLNQQRPALGQQDMRGWEWRYLWQFCRSDAKSTLCTRSNVITALSFSGDGSLLAVATEGGEDSIWNLAGTNMVFRTQIPCHCYDRIAFAPGENLLAYSDMTNIVVWNNTTRTVVNRLPSSPGLVDVNFISGDRLITSSRTGPNNVIVWNLANALPELDLSAPIYLHGVGVRFTASADGAVMAYAISNRVVEVVNLSKGTNRWQIPAAEELTTAMALSPDGTILATGGGYTESAIKLWDVEDHRYLGQLEGNRSWVEYLKFLPDGNLASAGADRTVRIWDVANRQPLRTLRGHRSEVRVLDVSKDGRTLASGDKDGTVLLWDLVSTSTRPPSWSTIHPDENPAFVRGFQFAPDSRSLAVVEANEVRLYDTTTLHYRQTACFGLKKIDELLLFSPDSKLLVATGDNGHLAVWDLPNQHLVTNFVANAGQAGRLGSSFQKGGLSLLTWGEDNVAHEWDANTWREMAHWPLFPGTELDQYPISSDSTNGLLAIRQSLSTRIEIFPVADPTTRRVLECPYWTSAIALSPDGGMIAGACEDGTLALWDTRTLDCIGKIRSVLLGLHSVAFSPDGHRIAAGGNGNEALKLWDAVSREDLLTLEGKGSLFLFTSFSPDGSMIASCGLSGVLHLWRAPMWEEIKANEQLQPR